jgi:hypothetical protein
MKLGNSVLFIKVGVREGWVCLESLRAAFESEFPPGFYLVEETQFQEWLEGTSITHWSFNF